MFFGVIRAVHRALVEAERQYTRGLPSVIPLTTTVGLDWEGLNGKPRWQQLRQQKTKVGT